MRGGTHNNTANTPYQCKQLTHHINANSYAPKLSHIIMQIKDGKATPYPNSEISMSYKAIIGIKATTDGTLWWLDMGDKEKSNSVAAILASDSFWEEVQAVVFFLSPLS